MFMTLGDNFHTSTSASIQHLKRRSARNAARSGLGTSPSRSAAMRLCVTPTHLVGNGVEILRATNHINQRSFYFVDPDGNTLEIYYELSHALESFPAGRDDRDAHHVHRVGHRGVPCNRILEGQAAARDEGEDRGSAPRLGLSFHREREDARCWSTPHAPPPATER